MMRQKIKMYSVNAKRLRSKMMSIQDTSCIRNLDFVHITEVVLGTHAAPEMKGFQLFKDNHKNPNRGSVLYVRDEYAKRLLRVTEEEKKSLRK